MARATAQDAAQRYDSAGALQRDLQHLLSHQPVWAMAGGAYRLRKGLRRHWPWVLAAGVALGLMLAITTRLVWQLRRAQAAEKQARQAESAAVQQLEAARKC